LHNHHGDRRKYTFWNKNTTTDHGYVPPGLNRNIEVEQYNGQKKKEKRSNNDLQNTTQKTRDPTTPTPL
jgi:hypothetical protein